MKYCSNCGQPLEDGQDVCLKCGNINKSAKSNSLVDDQGGFGYGLLGFCIPVVGLILYLLWKDERPNSANSAGKGALISVIVSVVFSIISFIVAIFLGSAGY